MWAKYFQIKLDQSKIFYVNMTFVPNNNNKKSEQKLS